MEFGNSFKTFKNQSYLQSSFTLLLFFASWSIWWSFFQIWLTSEKNGLGLTGSEVGTIYSANSLTTLILMFLYGIIQDKLAIKRTLLIFCASLSTLVGPFFIWIYAPLIQNNFMVGIFVGSIFLSAGFLAAAGIYEAVSERFSRYFDFKYGQARAWGSFGYAVSALIAGFLFVKNPEYNFWVGSVIGLLLLLNLIFIKPKVEDKAKHEITYDDTDASIPSFKEMIALLKLPHLWVIVIFIMFSWSFYTIYDQQMFPDFYTKLFETPESGQQMYGTLNSIQVFFEALMMSIIPIVMYKLGVKNTLMLGICFMVARIGLSGLLEHPISVSMIKMMHAIEVPLFMLPMFRYITLHFNPKLSATLYMIGFQIAAQIGQVILSTPLGNLRDHIGYGDTFLIISGIALLAGIFAIFTFKKDDEDVNGDPFIRQKDIKEKGA